MLEHWFKRPQTVDRIRHHGWPGHRAYAAWRIERGHAARNLAHSVPILLQLRDLRAGARCDQL